MKATKQRMYIIRHYVKASSLMDARRQSMKREPDEIILYDMHKNTGELTEAIGYQFIESTPEDEESSYT